MCNWNDPINVLLFIALFMGGATVALGIVVAYLGWQWKKVLRGSS